MRVIPRSHPRDPIPHRDTFAPANLLSRGREVAVAVDEAAAVNLESNPVSFPFVTSGWFTPRSQTGPVTGGSATRSGTCPPPCVRPRGHATARPWFGASTGADTSSLEPPPRAGLDPDAVAYHRRVTDEINQVLSRGPDRRNPR